LVDFERNAQPGDGRRAEEFDFATELQLLREFGSTEQGFSGAEDVFDEAAGELGGSGSGVAGVDEVREAEQLRFGIVNGDGEISGADEFIDDAVNGGEELLQILNGAGFFGNAIESGTESFGALALGDVAVDGVEGDGAAVDDERRSGDANVEQGAILTAALGFKSDIFAALQALDDPLGFQSAVGRKDQRVDGLAHELRGSVTEHPLKFPVHALGAEGGVDDENRVGRVLEELFEAVAAELGRILPIGFGGGGLDGIPG